MKIEKNFILRRAFLDWTIVRRRLDLLLTKSDRYRMKTTKLRYFIFLFCFLSAANFFDQQVPPTDRNPTSLGAKAEEGTLNFQARVQVLVEPGTDPNEPPTKKHVESTINEQLKYMFGPMEQGPKFDQDRAAPKGDHKLNIASSKEWIKISDKPTVWEINYDFEGSVVIEKGKSKSYKVYLPLEPKGIYKRAMSELVIDPETGKKICPCSDPHYPGSEEFFYFWGPKEIFKKCHLQEGQDYIEVVSKLERRPAPSFKTYPE
jgi:hypothetical protein